MLNITLPFATPSPDLEPGASASLADRLNHMSEDEFYAFCQRNPESKFERRADGTIEFLTMTGGTTGRRNSELITDLTIWNRQGRAGFVFDSSTGFRLPNGAVRSPDAAWVRAEAWQALPAGQQEKFPPLCPDFVVELLSPSDSVTDLVTKMQEYIADGCRLAWLIDPKTETARVFRADGSVSVAKSFAETLGGEDVLPGFAFPLAALR
ncbi:Uma2 family endonuclease [Hymenobacter sp.]|uniref:Uma2 family endonuclease n=1 Tax=Hymenobacter sp. TaxID=1898978 RepID=UPI00286B4C39|nr:Uma2 family endonuclease [Hymenobacter sp.]